MQQALEEGQLDKVSDMIAEAMNKYAEEKQEEKRNDGKTSGEEEEDDDDDDPYDDFDMYEEDSV